MTHFHYEQWASHPGGVIAKASAPNVDMHQEGYVRTLKNGTVELYLKLQYYPFPNHDTTLHVAKTEAQPFWDSAAVVHEYVTTWAGPNHASLWAAGASDTYLFITIAPNGTITTKTTGVGWK